MYAMWKTEPQHETVAAILVFDELKYLAYRTLNETMEIMC